MRLLQECVSTVYMLGIKNILVRCLTNDSTLTFADIIKKASKETPYGLFANSTVINLAKRINVPLHELTDFLIPK